MLPRRTQALQLKPDYEIAKELKRELTARRQAQRQEEERKRELERMKRFAEELRREEKAAAEAKRRKEAEIKRREERRQEEERKRELERMKRVAEELRREEKAAAAAAAAAKAAAAAEEARREKEQNEADEALEPRPGGHYASLGIRSTADCREVRRASHTPLTMRDQAYLLGNSAIFFSLTLGSTSLHRNSTKPWIYSLARPFFRGAFSRDSRFLTAASPTRRAIFWRGRAGRQG